MDDQRIFNPKANQGADVDVLKRLLDSQSIGGNREEISRFRIRIDELLELNGEVWVRRNAHRLLSQWETALKLGQQNRNE